MTTRRTRVAPFVFLNNRYHDPTLGGFISVDPLVVKTGQAYIYASANPISASDPLGLETCWVDANGNRTDACWDAADPEPPRPKLAPKQPWWANLPAVHATTGLGTTSEIAADVGVSFKALSLLFWQEGGYYRANIDEVVDRIGRASHGPMSMRPGTAQQVASDYMGLDLTVEEAADLLKNDEEFAMQAAGHYLVDLEARLTSLGSGSREMDFKLFMSYAFGPVTVEQLAEDGFDLYTVTRDERILPSTRQDFVTRASYYQYWSSVVWPEFVNMS